MKSLYESILSSNGAGVLSLYDIYKNHISAYSYIPYKRGRFLPQYKKWISDNIDYSVESFCDDKKIPDELIKACSSIFSKIIVPCGSYDRAISIIKDKLSQYEIHQNDFNLEFYVDRCVDHNSGLQIRLSWFKQQEVKEIRGEVGGILILKTDNNIPLK